MANVIDKITEKQLKADIPDFRVGDTVRVDVMITEGNKKRIQAYEGVVIGRKGAKLSETFTVRKVSYGVGIERIFKVHSPNITINVVRKGKARQAKLNFLRERNKETKFKERN